MPNFRCVLTHRATDKDKFDRIDLPVDHFIQRMLHRKHRVSELKDGSGIIGATFTVPGRLEQKYVETVTALILDFDGKFRVNGELVHEVLDPEVYLQKLPFRGFAHSSFSHTPEHPKFRVILPLEKEITPAEFHRLWSWVYTLVDKKADPACKNPDRMFYLPRCTAEAETKKWPWVRELTGPLLKIQDVPATFVAEMYSPPPGSGKKQGAHVAPPTYRHGRVDTEQLLACLLDLPVYRWALENPEALSREAWRGLAVNIAAAVLDDPAAHDDGAKAFHTLSEVDLERYDYGTTEKTFRDALKSAQHPGPMTYSTLVHHGAPATVAETGFKAPVAEARSRLWKTEQRAARAPSGLVTTPAGAAAAAATTETEAPPADEDDAEQEQALGILAENFLFDVEAAKWLQQTAPDEWSPPFTSEAMGQILLSEGLIRKKHDTFKARIRKFYRRVALYHTSDYYVIHQKVPVFNVYRKSPLVRRAGQYGDARDWPDYHIWLMNIMDEEQRAYEYMADWMARQIQSLHLQYKAWKQGGAPVLVGPQGTGKGTLFEVMSYMYGKSNCVTLGQEALDGRFNEEIVGKLFVAANEVMSASNRSAQTANKIKPWVTDATIAIEPKHKAARQVLNEFNIVFTSNDHRPVIVERSDRRYSVFATMRILDKGVATRLYDDMLGKQIQLSYFFDWILKRQTKIQYGELFHNDERKELMAAGSPSDVRFITAIQDDGWLGVSAHWVENAPNGKIREATVLNNGVTADILYDVYQDFCRGNGVKPFSRDKVLRSLKEIIPNVMSSRRMLGGLRVTVWEGLPMHSPHEAEADVLDLDTKRKELEAQKEIAPEANSFGVDVTKA